MNKEVCKFCGIKYKDFRTGFTYREIFQQFWVGVEDQTKWHPKRRRTILGRWYEIKKKLWLEHLVECEKYVSFNGLS